MRVPYTLTLMAAQVLTLKVNLLQVFVGSFRGKGFGPGGAAGPARGSAAPAAAAPAPAACKQARLLPCYHVFSHPGMQPSCIDVATLSRLKSCMRTLL